MDKQDLIYALEKMKRYIEEADEVEIGRISNGIALNTTMIPPQWIHGYEDFERRFVRLELRVR